MSQFGALKYTPVFGNKFSHMNTLHDRTDLIPSAAGLLLRDPHQQQGGETEKDMSLNTLVISR